MSAKIRSNKARCFFRSVMPLGNDNGGAFFCQGLSNVLFDLRITLFIVRRQVVDAMNRQLFALRHFRGEIQVCLADEDVVYERCALNGAACHRHKRCQRAAAPSLLLRRRQE